MTIDTDGLSEADFSEMAAKFDAAQAMLAALERFTTWNDKNQSEGRLEDALNAARKAIAQATAAGISPDKSF